MGSHRLYSLSLCGVFCDNVAMFDKWSRHVSCLATSRRKTAGALLGEEVSTAST